MLARETPGGEEFPSRAEMDRNMEEAVRSQQAYNIMADSLVAAFEWVDSLNLTDEEHQAAVDELYAYAKEQGVTDSALDYLRKDYLRLDAPLKYNPQLDNYPKKGQ